MSLLWGLAGCPSPSSPPPEGQAGPAAPAGRAPPGAPRPAANRPLLRPDDAPLPGLGASMPVMKHAGGGEGALKKNDVRRPFREPPAPMPETPPEVKALPLRLADVSAAAGIDFTLALSTPPPYNVVQMVGHGAAFLDFDQDGWMDLLLSGPRPRLYRNLHDGRFAPVEAGLGQLPQRTYSGVTVGDYDRDGYPDVFLGAYEGGVLLHNERGKALRDVTAASGLREDGAWSTSGSFADLDRDGWPDLVVGHYIYKYNLRKRLICNSFGVATECSPSMYPVDKPRVFKNTGGAQGPRFREVTREWGFERSGGRNLGIVAADLNGDGQPEVIIANDLAKGDLFVRKGPGFVDMGAISGTAYSQNSMVRGGMGVDVGDYDNDGKVDFVEMAFTWQGANLYQNVGPYLYKDMGPSAGVLAATFPMVSFGSLFGDLDNNGWLDLVIANGAVEHGAAQIYPGTSFQQPMQVLYNQRGTFWDLSDKLAGDARRKILGRALASADYDQDGRIDFVAVDETGRTLLLHNESEGAGHWLSIRLRNREGIDAIGATLYAPFGDHERALPCHADGGYLSTSDPRIHLGLGAETGLPRVTVQWVSGRRETFGPLQADRRVELREGTGQAVKGGGKE